MFCFQCQETVKNEGCGVRGVCGKTEETANLQDLLIHVLKGIALYAGKAGQKGPLDKRYGRFVAEALFATITNVNFDNDRITALIREALAVRDALKKTCGADAQDVRHDSAVWFSDDAGEFAKKAAEVGILSMEDPDVRSLSMLLIYGLKGISAYAEHAAVLGFEDETIDRFLMEALASTTRDLGVDDRVAMVMRAGECAVSVMALLDKANTTAYGNPEMSRVRIGVRGNPGILISGHDLKDLEELLKQTDGTGVDVYTHGEMLPAHAYPAFKKYDNFVGNYGNAWWKQLSEFESFRGPILFTTNCIVPPKSEEIRARIFTTGAAGFPGCKHINPDANGKKDFSAIIALAKTLPSPVEIERGEIVNGFAHAQVLSLADKVIDAVKSGKIKKFFVMAGCDGRMKNRAYYTEFAEKLPKDTVILTAGCAKFRYNKLGLGDIDGIPRVLDAGQCNDSYSLVVIAQKLAEAFKLTSVNELPLVFNIAWYEQKAVIVLLSLLSLGVKNIHLGPTLPGFLSPNVAKVLVDNFGIAGIGNVDDDIALFMN